MTITDRGSGHFAEVFMEHSFSNINVNATNGNGISNNNGHIPDVIRVSARSHSKSVAGAIAGIIRDHQQAEVQAIGAGAINQAVKALAISRGYLLEDEIDIMFQLYFTEVMIEGKERTAIRFSVRLNNSN